MAEAYLYAKFHLDPSNRWPQYPNVTDRQGRQDRTGQTGQRLDSIGRTVKRSPKNWNQFVVVIKAIALKQLISKFYPQIHRTDASDHIYVSQLITDSSFFLGDRL